MPENAIKAYRIVRISTDARKKAEIHQLYTLRIELEEKDEAQILHRHLSFVEPDGEELPHQPVFGEKTMDAPILIAGFGSAGLFAAYTLAKYGYKPIVIERGRDIRTREADVEAFCQRGFLNEESNVMFGEGGAGTFSDGKLMTRIKDPRAGDVIDTLARFGAPEGIRVQAKPHVGTDKLKKTVEAMRSEILKLGAEVMFEACLTDISMENGRVTAVRIRQQGRERKLSCCALILAIGQGARDTYRMLHERGIELQAKPFAVGVRIEHPREMIDQVQFGKWAGNSRLGAAEYHLSEQVNGRGVYTFCMCPGGVVIPSSSGKEQVVTNGMSDFARNAPNSNAAIVAQVFPADFGSGALDGLRFQEKLEKDAFGLGGGNYAAPVCRVGDFLRAKTPQALGSVQPSYKPGVKVCPLERCLPDSIADAIRKGIAAFGRRIRGFDMDDAVITAVESRTSAPVRIVRDLQGEATICKGLYPVGEGAGYAGGIISAAVDGMRAAEKIMASYRP